MSRERRLLLGRLTAILLVVAVSVYIFSIRERAQEFAIYGYPGIFLLSFMSNATVLLPAPGIAIVFAMGAVFHPLGVSLAAGAGGALGEVSGYLAGFSGQVVLEHAERYQRVRHWMLTHPRYSYLAILVLAVIPNPFFDLAGIAAGALRMPLSRFLFWVWVGNTLKMLLFAYAGAGSIKWLFTF